MVTAIDVRVRWGAVPLCGLLATALLIATSAAAQTVSDDARVTLALTGGATVGHETAGTLGAEGTIRVTRAIAVFAEGAHLWNVAPADLATRAQTIATAVGATATAAMRTTVLDAGLRFAWPTDARVQPYALVGAGAAHVTTETPFTVNGTAVAADALGIQVGRDLSGATTKATFMVGGGAVVPLSPRAFLDLGVRYERLFARPSQIPGDTAVNTVRLQAGVGVRF